jgi:tripeptide aminopeptidase
MDTAPDASGENIRPRIVKNYDGNDILLNEEQHIVLETAKYPEILRYKGQDIIVTDGTTLLGADDKAGVAEIITACEYLLAHPEIKHGKIRIGFTPDEEIGQGADHFDV